MSLLGILTSSLCLHDSTCLSSTSTWPELIQDYHWVFVLDTATIFVQLSPLCWHPGTVKYFVFYKDVDEAVIKCFSVLLHSNSVEGERLSETFRWQQQHSVPSFRNRHRMGKKTKRDSSSSLFLWFFNHSHIFIQIVIGNRLSFPVR